MYSGNVKLSVMLSSSPKGKYAIWVDGCEELDKLYNKNPGHLVFISIGKARDSKTQAQMRALRALISAFFFSGASSCPDSVDNIDAFTIWVKLQIDWYVDMEVGEQMIRVVKSFADASKDEMTDCVEKVLKLIDLSGATGDDKIQEIIKGMDENAKINGYRG